MQVPVTAYVLPAFYPPSKVLLESGPVFIDSPEREKLIEVSADGVVECRIGDELCPFNKEGNRHERLVVEMKCPRQPANLDLGSHYKLPSYYACQVLSEMAAHEVETCFMYAILPEAPMCAKYNLMKICGREC